ncbi:MAG: hypothetical protein KGO96_06815 [Elusimicrobia bacterium]|nr:hypothetical protein [Elusimicrobiota bacterium]
MDKLEFKILQNDVNELKKKLELLEKKIEDLIVYVDMLKAEVNSPWRN